MIGSQYLYRAFKLGQSPRRRMGNFEVDIVLQVAESIKDMIISVSQDLRRITLDLRPTALDDLGLVPALRWLADGFQKDTGIDVQIEVTGESPQISKKFSVNIFRIIQEALNNIRKHSDAARVAINLQFTGNSITVKVKDNGKGFAFPVTSSELTSRGKLGLIGMQQRAQFINGNITFHSEIGKGTTITLQCGLE
jgi:signal transduction histidine kinase